MGYWLWGADQAWGGIDLPSIVTAGPWQQAQAEDVAPVEVDAEAPAPVEAEDGAPVEVDGEAPAPVEAEDVAPVEADAEAPAQTDAGDGAPVEEQPGFTATDAPSLVGQGYRLLESGELQAAETAFLAALAINPAHLEALEGLAWTRVQRGDFERAAYAADARQALDPDGSFLDQWLTIIGLAPSRRPEAIAVYRLRIDAEPDTVDAYLKLAQLLSYNANQRSEAIALYRQALALEPSSVEARLGLALVLSWVGERAEANALFDELLALEPDHYEAQLGRARSARWDADWDTARQLLDACLRASPEDDRLFIERIQLELDPALQAAGIAVARELDAREAAARDPGYLETASRVGLYPTVSQDSDGFTRLNVRLEGEAHPLDNTRLRLLTGWTWFADDDDDLQRFSAGAQVRQGLPLGFFLGALYLARIYDGAPNVHELEAEAGLAHTGWPFTIRSGFSQRAIVDPLRNEAQIADFDSVGSSGLSVASMRNDIQIRDVFLSLSGVPLTGSYLYGEGSFGWMNDHNRRLMASAGLGIDILRLAGLRVPHELYLKYDFFVLSFERERPSYWSPNAFQVHTPGLAWNWIGSSRWRAGAELGVPIDTSDGSIGYLVGAYGRVIIARHWVVQARARLSDDNEYGLVAGTLGLTVLF